MQVHVYDMSAAGNVGPTYHLLVQVKTLYPDGDTNVSRYKSELHSPQCISLIPCSACRTIMQRHVLSLKVNMHWNIFKHVSQAGGLFLGETIFTPYYN